MRRDDLLAIQQLLQTYARLNDDARWHELAALFTDDAQFVRPTDPQRPIVGRAQILQSFLARPAGARRRHLVANPRIEFVDDDTAHATCYSVLLTAQGADGGTVTVGGFDDVLTRTADGWRFRSRTGSTFFDPVPFVARSGAPLPFVQQPTQEGSLDGQA